MQGFNSFISQIPSQKYRTFEQMDSSHKTKGLGSRICSKHFTESCFVVRPGKHGQRLYEHAVPSIFPNFPDYLQKSSVKQKSPKKRKYEEEPSCSVGLSKGNEELQWTE